MMLRCVVSSILSDVSKDLGFLIFRFQVFEEKRPGFLDYECEGIRFSRIIVSHVHKHTTQYLRKLM